MFTKDSIGIDLRLDRTDVYPGEEITGSMAVTVSSEVECSAIRIKIRGRTNTQVRVQERTYVGNNNTQTVTYTDEEDFFEHIITCYGFSSASNRKGGCFLYPGNTYAYDFRYTLPFDVPGTLACDMHSAKAYVTWIVRGLVDVPRGFDKEVDQELYVRAPAPASQIWNPLVMPSTENNVASCGCTGCYCCSTGEVVRVTPTVTPGVIMLGCDTYSNGQPANQVWFHVEVTNESQKVTIQQARVKIEQILTATARGRTVTQGQRVAEEILMQGDGGGYGESAGAYGSTLNMGLGQSEYGIFTGFVSVKRDKTVPSVFSRLFTVEHQVVIDFPHSKVKEGTFINHLNVATGEDGTNQMSRLPRGCRNTNQRTEQMM